MPTEPSPITSDPAIAGQGTAGGTDITSALKGITLQLAALVDAMGGTSAAAVAQVKSRR